MDRACSLRISKPDTACDSPEMSVQSGEIPAQPASPRKTAMDSRASHDTYRAACSASLQAPPAPILVDREPIVSTATVQGLPARRPDGAGIVVRAGSVVAPALLGDGPGTASGNAGRAISVKPQVFDGQSPRIETIARYLPHRRRTAVQWNALAGSPGERNSTPVLAFFRHGRGMVRGDRSSRRPSRPKGGTRSGDRREVSLSPVPAPQLARPYGDCPRRLPCSSRICRLPVAQHRS